MNGKPLEDYIAEYAAGKCDDFIRRQIDEKRKVDSAFNDLVNAHENLHTILTSTPKVAAPQGLSEKILSILREKEKRIEEEQTRYRRQKAALLPMGLFIAVASYFVYHFLMVRIYIEVYSALLRLKDINGIHSLSVQIISWNNIVLSLLKHPVSLPVFLISVPLYYLIALGVLMGTIWYLADDVQFKY